MEIDYENLIGQWHKDRNLIDGSTDKDQYMKLIQEAGELSDSLCKGKDISDDIGDMLVGIIANKWKLLGIKLIFILILQNLFSKI